MTTLNDIGAADGAVVATEHIRAALLAGTFVFEDGSVQTFEPSGATTYVDRGRPTAGNWYIGGDGRFCSFWPPDFRACYDLYWIVVEDEVVGVRFVGDNRGSGFVGRYRK
ncbi:hypothetical protein ACFQ34_14720 [Pseudonocardia benzenivorans]|jgi:hypothetical protein|uniref:Uncharacterized protein n=1 Tax=Pseudonocardia benzenivorans TaxID=228005 RepID=A0ABW3VIN4_9PSEU